MIALVYHIKGHYLQADLFDSSLHKVTLANSLNVVFPEGIMVHDLVLVVWVEGIIDLQVPQSPLPLISYPFLISLSHLLHSFVIGRSLLLNRCQFLCFFISSLQRIFLLHKRILWLTRGTVRHLSLFSSIETGSINLTSCLRNAI